MATAVLVQLDLGHLELLNLRLQMLPSDPSSPAEAWIYWNSAAHEIRVYNGTSWIALGSGAGSVLTVTAADGTIIVDNTDPANPTVAAGTFDHTHVSDFDTQVRTSRLDQMAAPAADVSINSHKLTNVADPTSAQDAATKAYVDALSQGLDFKASVRVIVTTNGTLATAYANGQSAGGVTLATGDRIALAGQTSGSENGFYNVNASGAPTRSSDADAAGEISKGTIVYVESGTNAGQLWVCSATSATPWVPNSSTSTWVQFTGAADITATAPITKTGNAIGIALGNGVTTSGGNLVVDPSVVVRKFAADIGDGLATSITVTHNLGTKDITWSVRQNSDDAAVLCDVVALSTTQATFGFAIAPANAALRVVVHG